MAGTTVAPITASTPVGTVFSGSPKLLSGPRLWAFSGRPFALNGWPAKNFHTDLETAQRDGLSAIAAAGTQFQGHLCELLLDLFGDAWLSGGQMEVRFIRRVDEDETVTCSATVRSVDADGDDVVIGLDVACHNQDGVTVMAGTASSRVPSLV